MTKRKPLVPPDKKQCQAMKPNGYSFMTLGGVPGLERCTNKPTVIAKEKKPNKDGRRGSMSLCNDCQKVFLEQYGPNYADLKKLTKTRPGLWKECIQCGEPFAYHVAQPPHDRGPKCAGFRGKEQKVK